MSKCYVCKEPVDMTQDFEVRDGELVRVDDRESWVMEVPGPSFRKAGSHIKIDHALMFHRSCHERLNALRLEKAHA